MQKLNNRQATILIFLLKTKTEIPLRQLSKNIGFPVRIIRFNLPYIESWLQAQNIQYNLHQNSTIQLEISGKDSQALLDRISATTTINYLSAEDRFNILLFDMLSKPQFHSGSAWQEELNISRSTLTRDLNKLEDWLAGHNLFLKRSPRLGTCVMGSLINMRHALIALLYEMKLESELLNYFIWQIHTSGKDLDTLKAGSLRILTKIHDWSGIRGWQNISQIQEKLAIKFTEESQLYLTLYWAIMIEHILLGRSMALAEERLAKLKGLPEYRAIAEITSDLSSKCSYTIPDTEIAQLTLEVITSIHGEIPAIHLAERGTDAHLDVKNIVSSLVSRISKRINIPLTHPEVMQKLEGHIARSLLRSEFDLPTHGAMGDEVQLAYPDIWKASQQSIQEVIEEFGVPISMNECGYITMYIALAVQLSKQEEDQSPRLIIVCPSGGVTVWMLLSRIKAELPEFKVLDVVSIKELSKVNRDKAAAIVSTVKIKDHSLPVIKVSPLLTDEDISNLKALLKPQS